MMTRREGDAMKLALRVALLLLVLGGAFLLAEAQLGRGEPQCGFNASIGTRRNVYWCGAVPTDSTFVWSKG
jgi:hypothetical protein